jgi:hypothetical protein
MGVTIITGSLSVIANNITTFLTATVGKQAACSRLHSGNSSSFLMVPKTVKKFLVNWSSH